MRTTCARAGFTLIELLVVVAIIALLISILLPGLSRAREQGKQTVCLANQKTIAHSVLQYAMDNRDAIVGSYTDRISWCDWPFNVNGVYLTTNQLANQTNTDAEVRGIMRGLLWRYIQQLDCYRCPSDARNTPRPEVGTIAWRTYSMTNFLNGDQAFQNQIGGGKIARRFSELRRPADSFAFVEESDPRGVNMNSWVFWMSQQRWIDPLTVWHYDRGTIGFADGHAIVRKWIDPRTIRMSTDMVFDSDATNNVDYRYLRDRWYPQ